MVEVEQVVQQEELHQVVVVLEAAAAALEPMEAQTRAVAVEGILITLLELAVQE